MSTNERRRYPRLQRPIDAKWRGHSGGSVCRIADIGWGGCFIEAMATPAIGEVTIVAVPVRGAIVEIQGTVQYTESAMGFSMEFERLTPDQVDALAGLLGEPPATL